MSFKLPADAASMSYRINNNTLKDLLAHAVLFQYHVNDGQPENVNKANRIQSHVLRLFALDYSVHLLDNSDGELGINYPAQMALLGPVDRGVATDVTRLRRLAMLARMGRCRGRFPISVILYRGRHVCRSATLSVGAEMYPRHYYYSMFGAADSSPTQKPGDSTVTTTTPPSGEFLNYSRVSAVSSDWDTADATCDAPTDAEPDDLDFSIENVNSSSQQLFDKIRSMDVRLLRLFGVDFIADLMVETKKVKFGLYVASSEKVDKLARYGDFSLLNIPYPGCEFFSRYCAGGYLTSQLQFNWCQKYINAELSLPGSVTQSLGCDFSQYRSWHTAELTANYLKVLLTCLHAPCTSCTCCSGAGSADGCSGSCGGGGGLLIHCISGWDRTPLFISLLRVSLWADGLIHQSLDPSEILFLTLAYDWFLFGHNLPDRIARDQEIMHFTFSFLKHIESDEFSAAKFMNCSDTPNSDTDVPPVSEQATCDMSRLLGSTDTVTGVTEDDDSTSLDLADEVNELSDAIVTTDGVNELSEAIVATGDVNESVCQIGEVADSVCLDAGVNNPVALAVEVNDPASAMGQLPLSAGNVDADISVLSSSCDPAISLAAAATTDSDDECRLSVLLERCGAAWCQQTELPALGGVGGHTDRSDTISTHSLSSCQSACSSLNCIDARSKQRCVDADDDDEAEADNSGDDRGVGAWPFVPDVAHTRSYHQQTGGCSGMEESFCRLDLCETGATSGGGCCNYFQQQQNVLAGVSPLAVRRWEHRQWKQRQASSSLDSLPEQRSVLCAVNDLPGQPTVRSPADRTPPLSTTTESLTTTTTTTGAVGSTGVDCNAVPAPTTHQTTVPAAPSSGQRSTLVSSPLHVPPSARARHESCGSVGSWQIVSECGSMPGYLGSDSCSHSPFAPANSASTSLRETSPTSHTCVMVTPPEFVESTTTITGESSDDEEVPRSSSLSSSRAGRLRAVRMLFLQTYGASVGLRPSPSAPRALLTDEEPVSAETESGSGAPRAQCVRHVESGGAGRFRLIPTVVSTLAGRVGIM